MGMLVEGEDELVLSESVKEMEKLESSWDRLRDDESQGLLSSPLKMRKQDLGILASGLDAHPFEWENFSHESKGDNNNNPKSNVRKDSSQCGSTPKGDFSGNKPSYTLVISTIAGDPLLAPFLSSGFVPLSVR